MEGQTFHNILYYGKSPFTMQLKYLMMFYYNFPRDSKKTRLWSTGNRFSSKKSLQTANGSEKNGNGMVKVR